MGAVTGARGARPALTLLRERHHVARAGDAFGPGCVEIGDQRLEVVAGERGVASGLVGEAIDRVMHALLHLAPETPGLLALEDPDRPRKVVGGVPMVEPLALGRGDDGTDEEEGGAHIQKEFYVILSFGKRRSSEALN
jgi:hypothetical protein